MGQITLPIPQAGQLNSTEDPKVASNFTTIQTVINGNLDDTNAFSPNNAVRRVLLQASSSPGSPSTIADYLLMSAGFGFMTNGQAPTGAVPMMWGDQGLSGNPTCWTVPNKTTKAIVRASVITNGTAPGVAITAGLYQITLSSGSSGQLLLSFGSALGGSGGTISSPAAGFNVVESAPFTLPTNNLWALGIATGGGVAAGCVIMVTASLLAYNA